MKKAIFWIIGIVFVGLISKFIPVIVIVKLIPEKEEYSYGEEVTLDILELNIRFFPMYGYTMNCGSPTIKGSYISENSSMYDFFSKPACNLSIDDPDYIIAPFWYRRYRSTKILVPYTQKLSFEYLTNKLLYVGPGENTISVGRSLKKIYLPNDDIETFTTNCNIYNEEKVKNACLKYNTSHH